MAKKTSKSSNARQRIVETAERLFYAEGIHNVGIDRIIAEAEVAKMTLYNHFASKDELILAVLQYREEQFDNKFTKAIDKYTRKGMNRLEAFFNALKEWFKSPGFRGCSFINACVELANSGHPASEFSTEHKVRFHSMLEECIVETSGKQAAPATPAVALLVEGAIVMAVMQDSWKPAESAKDAALSLIAQYSKKKK